MSPSVNYYNLSTVCLLLITSDNDNCSTQRMLRNRISCVCSIVIMKGTIIITNQQSAFYNFLVVYKV